MSYFALHDDLEKPFGGRRRLAAELEDLPGDPRSVLADPQVLYAADGAYAGRTS